MEADNYGCNDSSSQKRDYQYEAKPSLGKTITGVLGLLLTEGVDQRQPRRMPFASGPFSGL